MTKEQIEAMKTRVKNRRPRAAAPITEKDIKEALLHCTGNINYSCTGCAYEGKMGFGKICMDFLLNDLATLLNKKDGEIMALEHEVKELESENEMIRTLAEEEKPIPNPDGSYTFLAEGQS